MVRIHLPPARVSREPDFLESAPCQIAGAQAGTRQPSQLHGFAHDQLEIAALQSRQFFGEQRHALPPGAWHPGDVGAPEHPLGTEANQMP